VAESLRNEGQLIEQAAAPPPSKPDYVQQLSMGARTFRSGGNLERRNAAFQAVAQQQQSQQRVGIGADLLTASKIVEGVPEVFWFGARLLVARRTIVDGAVHVQGCWLNWDKLQEKLLRHTDGVLPQARLEPVLNMAEARANRVLAAIPAQLIVPDPILAAATWTPARLALVVAWTLMVLTAAAAAWLLHAVVALSERRAAFVSAVTHELRTPLTTFRLYSEMLAEGMVSEPQRASYTDTLRREAERLSHLVENVLQYARLERGVPPERLQVVSLAKLLERVAPVLRRRTEQAGMTMVMEPPAQADGIAVRTDPGIIEQILFNLVDNACKYAHSASDRRIHCCVEVEARTIDVLIRDHGPGIASIDARRLFRPFRKSAQEAAESAPGVGLGLALCRRLARQIGGRLEWRPVDGGATFALELPRTAS
jgi:signal transduction histidine kinase